MLNLRKRLPVGGVEFRMLAQLFEDNIAQGHGSGDEGRSHPGI